MKFTLRPYQQYCIDEYFNAIENSHRNICISLKTGTGKTISSSAIAQRYTDNGEIILFVVPRLNLISQTKKNI